MSVQQWFNDEHSAPFYSCIFDKDLTDCYAWGLSKTIVDENGVPKADVEAVYVDEVCRYDSFSALGL